MSFLDSDIIEKDFELQLFYNVHFQTKTLGERYETPKHIPQQFLK